MQPENIFLNTMDYAATWELQQQKLHARIQNKIPDTLLFVEHPPVITLGRKSPGMRELEAKGQKEWQGLPLYFAERGGEATYHGPGQLVVYPIVKLSPQMGPKIFLRLLEVAIIQCLAKFQIKAKRHTKHTGVWLKDKNGKLKKIASLGIAVRQSVSYHGLALNISTDLNRFRLISPCGLEPSVMTSIKEQTGFANFAEVQKVLAEELASCLLLSFTELNDKIENLEVVRSGTS